MSMGIQDIEKKAGSTSATAADVTETQEKDNSAQEVYLPMTESDVNEMQLERAIKHGLRAPFAKVLLRLLLAILVVSSLTMFVTGLMKYNELMREKEILELRKDALEDEIAELKYMIDCPVDHEYIVRVAREKLGLHLPNEIVYYNDAKD